MEIIQWSHLCLQHWPHTSKMAVHLNFEHPVCPALLLLMLTVKILLVLLTHHSIYHLLRFVFMFYMGDIVCSLIIANCHTLYKCIKAGLFTVKIKIVLPCPSFSIFFDNIQTVLNMPQLWNVYETSFFTNRKFYVYIYSTYIKSTIPVFFLV